MSKGLECLKDIDNLVGHLLDNADCLVSNEIDYDEAFRTIEKELKALEIIKKKNVNCFKLRFCKNLEDYNLYLEGFVNPETKKISSESYLNQEEFDLLKEVLEEWRIKFLKHFLI